MNNLRIGLFAAALVAGFSNANAQVVAADSVMQHNNGKRLTIGGYGEVAYSRNFYSDHVSRYSQASEHKNDPSHGRFDIPHAVIYIGYDFGKGWSLGTEIEFEHGGTGTAYEKEDEEGGEWESETEKGGEVELEQFWIQKSFGTFANIRAGHIVVPVGLNNAYHEPLNFFTVYRPEGENTVLPSTWHQTGLSFWGRYKDWRYEAQFLAGLNADNFTNTGWINKGPGTPLESEIATKYGGSLRIDNYSIKGLRIGLSGYYGHSIGNSYPKNKNGADATYKGVVAIGAIDFTYNDHNWIVRGQADYGYLSDAAQLKYFSNRVNALSPYHHTAHVSKNAFAYGIEAGYDVFSQIGCLRKHNQKMYVFGRYEHYNPYASNTNGTAYDYTNVKRMAVGINYFPIKQIVVKAEFSKRFLKSQYNDEPSVNIGIAYEGVFSTDNFFRKKHHSEPALNNEQLERLNKLAREVEELKNRQPIVLQKEGTKLVDNAYVVNFAQDASDLSADAKSELDKVPAGASVDVNAFASPEGNAEYNKTLSEKRALAVKSYLEGRGVKVDTTNCNGAVNKYSNRIAVVTVK